MDERISRGAFRFAASPHIHQCSCTFPAVWRDELPTQNRVDFIITVLPT